MRDIYEPYDISKLKKLDPNDLLQNIENNVDAVLYQIEVLRDSISANLYTEKLQYAHLQIDKAYDVLDKIPKCLQRKDNGGKNER